MIKLALIILLLGLTSVSAEEINYEPMDYKAFNQSLQEGTDKASPRTNDPVIVALNFIGPTEALEQTIIRKNESAEASETTVIIITNEGLLDDSVQSVKYKIALKKTNNIWFVQSALKAHKCWQGRGHSDYSAKPCN